MNLVEAYKIARTKPSDINEHVPTLRRYAEQCRDVVEFGVRRGVSTTALLAGSIHGKLERLDSYEVNPTGAELALKELAPDVFNFYNINCLKADFAWRDMAFIDTYHTFKQLTKELELCHDKIRYWIILHDTVKFKEFGEDDTTPGLAQAVWDFQDKYPRWRVCEHHKNNNGLTVLSKMFGGGFPEYPL